MDLERVKIFYKEMSGVNEKQEKKLQHLETKALHLAIFYVLFQAVILHSISPPPAILHQNWWIPFSISLLIAILFGLTFVSTVIEWARTQYEHDANLMECEDIYLEMATLQTRTLVSNNSANGLTSEHRQQLFEPDRVQLCQRYAYICIMLFALLAYTIIVLYACKSLLYDGHAKM